MPNETSAEMVQRIDNLKSKIKNKIKNKKRFRKDKERHTCLHEQPQPCLNEQPQPCQQNPSQTSNTFHSIHPNPAVSSSIQNFEEGEQKHSVATCIICKECRPLFHASYDNSTTQVKLNSWKVDKKGVCNRCKTDRAKRRKGNGINPAKFSGYLSEDTDLGPVNHSIRHNNQHFLPVPPFLQNLTAVELALISKITICMNVHMLRHGMMAAKGHSISIPQRMAIARKLPQLPENVGIVVLRRKGSKDTTKNYTVKRSSVENALKGLCYGLPIGGFEHFQPDTQLYTGPDHILKPLKGRYFHHLPNQYYYDVQIQEDRINQLPDDRIQFPQLKIIDMQKDVPEEDQGPAPEQFQIPTSPTDDSVTTSGITLPLEPKDAEAELQALINKIIGKETTEQVAVAQWDYADGEPLSELKTPGFFAMSFPSIFVNGSCDLTHNALVKIEFDEWVNHIYFQGDGRVPKHPFLKFFLYNLALRKQALKQGNFLVAQQLNDTHISIAELQERVENNDDSIPRKIIKMGGNLVNTDPYWMNRRQELEAFTFYRRKEKHDLPAYFTTNSIAELHWTPLINLMAKYLAETTGKDESTLKTDLSNNSQFLRKAVLENLHLTTLYFDARTKNYYNSVFKTLFDCDDYFFRYEFAKSRGQIHTHGVLFSQIHAKKVEGALQSSNNDITDEQRAQSLYQWLQTDSVNEERAYSPHFTSLHPAGGEEITNENGGVTWVPNKEGWPKPEGTQEPPEFDPLKQKLSDFCTSEQDIKSFHTYLTNRVAIHECNGYCLRKKKLDSETKHCRVHFGKLNPVTKKTTGKEVHPFNPLITGNNHPRYEGPRDHPRLVMHVKAHLLSWLANCDTQAIIDQDLLNLQKYIVAYACKGAASTEELITIYKHLLDSSDSNASVKNIVHRLLMKLVGMIDVPAAAVDFINAGGKLYHATRHFQRIGLSGYRPLNKKGNDDNITSQTLLDQFLSDERRQQNPHMSLWDWSKQCKCKTKCLNEHVPVFTGGPVKPVWPLSEDFCRLNLMIFSRGTWKTPEDLKGEHDNFSQAFAEFLESDDCSLALKEVVALSKRRFDKKVEKDRKKLQCFNQKETQSTQMSQETVSDADSQFTLDSQDSTTQNMRLGHALLKDISDQNKVHFEKVADDEVPLFDGGVNFNWNEYAIQSLGYQWEETVTTWLQNAMIQGEAQLIDHMDAFDLPEINLLYANPLQRLIIALNVQKLLEAAQNDFKDVTPLRLLVQGTAGTGKTFIVTAISHIVRRLSRRNGSVMNLAPTGSAANLLPNGATVHSTLPPLSKLKKKECKTAQMTDYPLSDKALKKLRKRIGYNDNNNHQLLCLNMDERSMFSHRLLAWSSQRLCEATGDYNHSFGNVPIVNFFGDIGQLGPVDAKDLHVQPGKSSAPDELAGYAVYRQFDDCVLLSQTMRQKQEQKLLLDRLLRIRNGTITQQDWIDINARYESDLPVPEKQQFQHDKVITLHETWAEVKKENRSRLANLGVPVAIIPSTGRGRHHQQGEKQMGQIPPKCLIAVGARIILTKNQGALTQYGLNNGAVGKVVAILYTETSAPPSMPIAVICDFPAYKGPIWSNHQPTWVPIIPDTGRCESNCCSRTGMPLMPGYSVPVAKSQGMTVGDNKPATHMRIKLQAEKFMEALSLGTSYTAFSRVEAESRWCLVEKIPQDRLLYINSHPHMVARRSEEQRLLALSKQTVSKFPQFLESATYVQILQELDQFCNDGLMSSVCANPNINCPCLLCQQLE